MILAFGDDHWRAPCFKRRQDVIEDEIVSRRVLSEACIKFLDGRLFIGTAPREPELRAPENDLVIEGPSGGLLFGIDAMADRAALHEDNRVMAILPRHRRRQTYWALAPRAMASKPTADR